MSERAERLKIIYIAGTRRSGSTVLANLLGEHEEFFVGGEMANFWFMHSLDLPCGCGLPASLCPVWPAVVSGLGVEHDRATSARLAFKLSKRFPGRFLPLLFNASLLNRLLVPRALRTKKHGADPLGDIYAAIARKTGARVIIDSSKSPAYAQLLAMRPELDVFLVHLVRDPTTNVPAMTRRPHPDLPPLSRFDTALWRSVSWTLWHLAIEILWKHKPERYRRVRYEDFVADPAGEIGSILNWVGERSSLEVTNGTVALSGNHSAFGNPRQVREGPVTVAAQTLVVADSAHTQRVIRVLTWPMRRRYYPAA